MCAMVQPPSLLDLSEDVICVLLRYLDATTLFLLSRTCSQLEEIIRSDYTLWRRIDARRDPNTEEKNSYCLERIYDDGNSGTRVLLLRGSEADTIVPNFFQKINRFSKLTILAFENQTIDGNKYNVKAFPPHLHELSLRWTRISNSLEFFKWSSDHLKQLKVLVLDGCDWLASSAFMALSKYSNLEILSVYKCKNLENSIAYLSLSSQGFKALKIFDARLTPLGNTVIRAIYRMQSLLAIYLQNEDVTYKLDYFRRKLQLMNGAKSRNFFHLDEEFNMDEFLKNEENDLSCEDKSMLDDNGLLDYLSVLSTPEVTSLPHSYLYVDPYNQCTCKFDQKPETAPTLPPDDQSRHLSSRLANVRYQQARRGLPRPLNNNFPNYITMNFARENRRADDNDRPPIRICFFQHDEEDEPPSKRQRTDGAGPSGLANQEESSDEDGPALPRPPTPHPDVVIHPQNDVVRVFFMDYPPVLQIESIENINKEIKVPLKRLSLRGFKKITNKALFFIRQLDLDVLDLTYTSVTVDAIEAYLKRNPLCRVVHEKFCTCPTNLHF